MNRRQFIVAATLGAAAVAPRGLVGVSAAVPGTRGDTAPTVVLVTDDASGQVAVVDPVRGERISHVATYRQPRSIERVGVTAVVAHTELGRLTLIDEDLSTRAFIGHLEEPRYVAAHPDGRHAVVSDSGRGEVVVIDVIRGRVVGRVPVGGPARHLTLDPTGRRLWTALGTTAERIALLDVSDLRRPVVRRHVRPPFLAHDVVYEPSGDRVWVTSGDRSVIAIYDVTTRRLIRTIAAGAPPQHIAFSETGRVAYVTSGDDGTMRVHALNGRLLTTSRIPVGSYNVTRGGGHVVSPSLDRGTLCVMNRHGQVRRTLNVAPSAHDACVIRIG
jgi:DNA-binding beta-propeller fold protein YncE